MATSENRLYVVTRRHWLDPTQNKSWVFRTRKAARDFVAKKKAKAKSSRYQLVPATWGPDN